MGATNGEQDGRTFQSHTDSQYAKWAIGGCGLTPVVGLETLWSLLEKRLNQSSVYFLRTDSNTFIRDVTRGRQHKSGTPDTQKPQGREKKSIISSRQVWKEGRRRTLPSGFSPFLRRSVANNKQFNYSSFLPASQRRATPLVSNSSSYCRLTMIPALRSLLLAAEQMMRALQSNWVSAAMSNFFSLSPLQTKTRPKSSMNAKLRGHCVCI